MSGIIHKEDSFDVVGVCMEVHSQLGPGFLEIVYKDAIEVEFNSSGIKYGREIQFDVQYKGAQLRHKFFADFTVFDKIILEVKCAESLHDIFYAQSLNYLKVSGYRLALLVNFGQERLEFKRIVL
jgi:GxxExxY protein